MTSKWEVFAAGDPASFIEYEIWEKEKEENCFIVHDVVGYASKYRYQWCENCNKKDCEHALFIKDKLEPYRQ